MKKTIVLVLLSLFSLCCLFFSVIGILRNINGTVVLQTAKSIDPLSAVVIGIVGLFISMIVGIILFNKKWNLLFSTVCESGIVDEVDEDLDRG